VVGLVLGDVRAFAVIVGWSPGEIFIDGHQPLIVKLAEFGEGLLASFRQGIHIKVEVVTGDGLARRIAKIHGYVPLLLDAIRPTAPLDAFESL